MVERVEREVLGRGAWRGGGFGRRIRRGGQLAVARCVDRSRGPRGADREHGGTGDGRRHVDGRRRDGHPGGKGRSGERLLGPRQEHRAGEAGAEQPGGLRGGRSVRRRGRRLRRGRLGRGRAGQQGDRQGRGRRRDELLVGRLEGRRRHEVGGQRRLGEGDRGHVRDRCRDPRRQRGRRPGRDRGHRLVGRCGFVVRGVDRGRGGGEGGLVVGPAARLGHGGAGEVGGGAREVLRHPVAGAGVPAVLRVEERHDRRLRTQVRDHAEGRSGRPGPHPPADAGDVHGEQVTERGGDRLDEAGGRGAAVAGHHGVPEPRDRAGIGPVARGREHGAQPIEVRGLGVGQLAVGGRDRAAPRRGDLDHEVGIVVRPSRLESGVGRFPPSG